MSEFSEKMGIEVGNAFKSGYNCSEAIVEAFRKYAGVNIDDNAFRLASGFGGGIGHARNICGALVGCTMVISTLIGRNTPEDLMPYEFNTRDHLKNCLKLTNRIGKFLAEFLEEKGLLTV